MYFWTKGSKYYEAYIQPNLLGEFTIIKSWGSMDSNRGNHKIMFCENQEQLENIIEQIKKRRKYRGYSLKKYNSNIEINE